MDGLARRYLLDLRSGGYSATTVTAVMKLLSLLLADAAAVGVGPVGRCGGTGPGSSARELATSPSEIEPPVDPWTSDEEIGSGRRWRDEIGTALGQADLAIVCVTAVNQHAPRLMFERALLRSTWSLQGSCHWTSCFISCGLAWRRP